MEHWPWCRISCQTRICHGLLFVHIQQRALRCQASALQALKLSFNSLLNGFAAAGVVLVLHSGIESAQDVRAGSDGYFGLAYGVAVCHTNGRLFDVLLQLLDREK